jgi:hypothetical protein
LVVSGEVNRMIALAINVDPRWFWEGRRREAASAPHMMGLDIPE